MVPDNFISSIQNGGNGSMRLKFTYAFLLLTLIWMHVAPASALQQMEPKEFAKGVEYEVLMSRDDEVCTRMLTLFNHDLVKFGSEKYDEHEEFRVIGWKKETITRMEGNREVVDSVEAAHVDINNDGKMDLVFRRTGPMRGYDRDTLYIFPSLGPSEKRWTLMGIARSPGRISHGGYALIKGSTATKGNRPAQIPPMASISRLDPFRFGGTTYIGMRPLYELVTGTDPVTEFSKVYIITKYRGGKYGGGPDPNEIETGKRDDICYLKVRTKTFVPGRAL
jgi:hypothetical protein